MSRVYGRAGMRIGQGLLFIGQMGGGAVLRNDEPPLPMGSSQSYERSLLATYCDGATPSSRRNMSLKLLGE